MKVKDYILFSIVLFLIVFNPPVKAGVSFTVLFVLISVFLCFVKSKVFFSFIKTRGINLVVKAYVIFFLYNVLFSLFNFFLSSSQQILNNLFQDLWTTSSLFAISFFVVFIANKKKASFDDLCSVFILVGLYQTVIGLICLLNPSVKELFNSMVIANSGSPRIREIYEVSSAFRHFGFAATTFDIFGATMSILAVITANKGLNGDRLYYLLSFFVSIVAIINARTSFFLIMIGLTTLFLSHRNINRVKQNSGRILVYMTLIVFVIALGYTILKSVDSEQGAWLLLAVEETQSLSQGSKEGYFDTLFNEFLFFPTNPFHLLFGTGLDPDDAVQHGSDVGYVKYIWLHGIVGSILLYRIYIIMFKEAIKNLNWPDSSMVSAIRMMIIIYLIKLTCLGYSMASVVFVPLCFYAIYINTKMPKPDNVEGQIDTSCIR